MRRLSTQCRALRQSWPFLTAFTEKDPTCCLTPLTSQLVLVDYQSRLMPAIFEAPLVLANALRLAQVAKLVEVPVWGTGKTPRAWGPTMRSCAHCATKPCRKCISVLLKRAWASGCARPPNPSRAATPAACPKHLQNRPPRWRPSVA